MKLLRFEAPGLAHYSYVLSSQGKAVIVDPKRDIDTYLSAASEHNVRISHIIETHIHADYASGAKQLAEATGAELWLSGHDQGEDFEYQFPHTHALDGQELRIGDLLISALHTPGHTPEHLSFLVHDLSRGSDPLMLLSGDFVFVGSLGRPDLLGEAAKHRLATQLYSSVHDRISMLPDYVEVHPTHGAGSLCGADLGERHQSTLGYERRLNAFMRPMPQHEFVHRILSTVPPFPDYYRRMKRVNSVGAPSLNGIPGDRALAPIEFRYILNTQDAIVLDTRRAEAFGGSHIPDSINVALGPTFGLWAPWVVPYDKPILLVGDGDLEPARRALIRVGLDDIRGYLDGGMANWIDSGYTQAHLPQECVTELAGRRNAFILDVRTPGERESGHIEGSIHIPANEVESRMNELPDGRVHVMCASGFRSSIVTSLLKRAGRDPINVAGGMNAWRAADLPTVLPAMAAR
jgi:hydroxyacylglutathione hydrolase